MLRTILVLLIFGGGFAAALFSRFAALMLYTWFAFFRPQEWVWFDITSLHLSMVLALVLIVPALITGSFPVIRHTVSGCMILLVAAAFVAELVTPMPRTDWSWLSLVAKTALIDLLLISLVDTKDRLWAITMVAIGSVGFHTAKQGAVLLATGSLRVGEGVGGSFGDSNSYAVVCAMTALLFLAMAPAGRNMWQRFGLRAAGTLSLLTVIATFSRGGFLAAACGLIVLGLLRGIRLRWHLGAVVVAGALWAFMPLPDGYTDRLKSIGTYAEDASASGRLHFWAVALNMSWNQPLGVGVENFNRTYDRYDPSEGGAFGMSRSVHNSHLQVLTEAGFLGFGVWVFMLINAVVLALRVRRRGKSPGQTSGMLYTSMAEGMAAALVAFIVGGSFTAIAWNDFVWCMLAILAALDRVSLREIQAGAESMSPVAISPAAPVSSGAKVWSHNYARS